MKRIFIGIIICVFLLNNYETIHQYIFTYSLLKNELKQNETYNYDLDGNGVKEKIVIEKYKDVYGNFIGNLYINDELKYRYADEESINMYLYDFNKIDNRKEICVIMGTNDNNYKTNIFMYEEDKESENYHLNGKIINNDDKTGLIKIANGSTVDSSTFESFNNVIGGESININYSYKRVVKNELIDVEDKEVAVVGMSKNKEYIALEDIIVYETNMGDAKAYTLYKDDTVKLTSLYSSGDNKCIKVVNKEGRYGWIKISENQILG